MALDFSSNGEVEVNIVEASFKLNLNNYTVSGLIY